MTPQDPLTPSVPLSTSGLSEGEGADMVRLRRALDKVGYQRVFNAIADAVDWHPNSAFGISVEKLIAGLTGVERDDDGFLLSPAPVLQGDVAGLTLSEAFELGFEWRARLQGQTLEDSRAVGRTLQGPMFDKLRLDLSGWDSFQSADLGICEGKRRILSSLASSPIQAKPDVTALVEALRPFARLYNQIMRDHGAEWFADEGQVMRAALAYPVANNAVVWRHFRLAAAALSAFQDHQGGA